jgi:drug/metabolite transporter (DMT)-like permease
MTRHWFSYVETISSTQATIIICLTAICFGTVPWFAKELLDSGIASPAVAFYRYAISALLFFWVMPLKGPSCRETIWAVLSGVCVGLGWIGFVEALKVVPIASASVIYMTYPLFTLIGSWLLIKNVPNRKSLVAGGLILIAAFLAYAPSGLSDEAIHSLTVAFVAPVAFGVSIAVLTDKLQNLSPLQRLAGFTVGASLGLLPIVLILPLESVLPNQPKLWVYMLCLAFLTALLPQYLYSTLAPIIGPARSAMAGSIELPTMFVIGFLIYGESIGWIQIFSGMLVMVAILITPAISSNRRVTQFETE